ncbi:MAG: domain S-box protein, partial [Frankiales bacterium]|nr:domain S-box protein [Frankiales bacterium]
MELLGISEQLIEALPDAVFVVSTDGTIVFLNSQAETLFGYARAELLGQPIERLVPPDCQAVHPGHRDRYTRDAHPRPMGAGLDLSGMRKDGTPFPAEISLSAIETAEGRLVTAVVRDATERKKTQMKFEGLLEAAPDAMLGVDADGSIRLFNTQAERLFGYQREELIGQPIERLVPDRARAGHPERRQSYFTDPQVRPMGAGIDLSGRRRDGTEFPAEISLSSIETEDGVLVTAAVRDVTERKAFEMVVAGARDTAERAARSRQEFLANMSHEIRTPMNAVIGMTSLLLDTDLDTDQLDYVETIRTSGDHLLTIINDILDYAKIDAGKLLLEELPFDLRQWLQETLDLITVQAHDKDLEIACDVDPDVPQVVVGDPSRLRQVLINLLSNAVKFTAQGEVVVRVDVDAWHEHGVLLHVSVTDTGVGIAPERVAALFDPFTQADSTTTRLYGGTGLGLAISRQLVESMGGSITMESEVGEGTTVSFTFLGGRSAKGPGVASEGLEGKRLLIVDDNRTNCRILQSWAERRDITCVSAAGSEEALKVVTDEEPFDFAVLDLMMPGMDGSELGQRLRANGGARHLVLLSSAGPYARHIAGQGTFDAVLSKPANQEQLFTLLADL